MARRSRLEMIEQRPHRCINPSTEPCRELLRLVAPVSLVAVVVPVAKRPSDEAPRDPFDEATLDAFLLTVSLATKAQT